MDAALGSFRGLAVGDALGAPVEFQARGTFVPVTGFQPFAPFGLRPGQWTDDTIMAVCLAEALIEAGGYDSHHVMNKYLKWFTQGYNSPTGKLFGVGAQTARALRQFQADPGTAARTRSAGNGTVMRLAPAAVATLGGGALEAAEVFEASARDTHNSDLAAEATVLFGMILRELLNGAEFGAALQRAARLTDDYWQSRGLPSGGVASHVLGYTDKEADSDGFVLPSLGTAIWAVRTTDSFQGAVLKAVNLGGDADTVGAITGQMAGALYGDQAIPDEWKASLHRSADFERLTRLLAQVPGQLLRTRTYL